MPTFSLNLRSRRLLRSIIEASQSTPFGPSFDPRSFELKTGGSDLISGEHEYSDHDRFFRHFHGRLARAEFRGKRVLDVGCGYGGRTVYYALDCGATEAHGVEINEAVVDRCQQFAKDKGANNVSFSLAFAERLPFPAESFDMVLSFDVLEHVNNPAAAIREMARVIRPGGTMLAVFPTYKGARISHLDYVTRVPLLHRIFHPDALIAVVNALLVDPKYGTNLQPPPKVTSLQVYALPTLNGLTLARARKLLDATPGLAVTEEILTPLVDSQLTLHEVRESLGGSLGLAMAVRAVALGLDHWQRRLPLPEVLIQNIAIRARKNLSS